MALRICSACEGSFSEYSFPFNGEICKKCHEAQVNLGGVEPVVDMSRRVGLPPVENLNTVSGSSEQATVMGIKQDKIKISPLIILSIAAFALVACIMVYRTEAENERQRKTIEMAEGIRIRDAKQTVTEMANEIFEFMKRIDELTKKRATYSGLDYKGRDSMLPTIGANGDIQLAGTAVNDINNEIARLTSSSESTFRRIDMFARDNKIDTDPELSEYISKLKMNFATIAFKNAITIESEIVVGSTGYIQQNISNNSNETFRSVVLSGVGNDYGGANWALMVSGIQVSAHSRGSLTGSNYLPSKIKNIEWRMVELVTSEGKMVRIKIDR